MHDDVKPSDVLTRAAFLNAIRVNTAIGGSTNAPPHLQAVARHAGVELDISDWEEHGLSLPLLVDCAPSGKHLCEAFHRAGGVPAVMGELLAAGLLDGTPLTVTGADVAANVGATRSADTGVIRAPSAPLKEAAGFKVIRGNLFDSALMKTSVISDEFRRRFLEGSTPGRFEARAVVIEVPEDYNDRHNDPSLQIHEETILFSVRRPRRLPGRRRGGEHAPPDAAREGVTATVGDGRQSGTSESPSIPNASPRRRSAAGSRSCRRATASSSTSTPAARPRRRRRRARGGGGAHAAEFVNQTPWQGSTARPSASSARAAAWARTVPEGGAGDAEDNH